MKFGIGYIKRNGDIYDAVIQKHLTKPEYDQYVQDLSDINLCSRMKQMFQLVKFNHAIFLDFMAFLQSDTEKPENYSDESILLEANRLFINFLNTFGMFIDYGEKNIKKAIGIEAMHDFNKRSSEFYDGHVSYRFMNLMRNFVVHYDFPLTTLENDHSNCYRIFTTKEHLLQFKKWKHVKSDIEKMPNVIALEAHVEVVFLFINNLYEHFVYTIAPKLVHSLHTLNYLIKNNGGNRPALFEFNNEEDLKKRVYKVNPVSFQKFQEVLEDLKVHPDINIVMKQN
ncbi:hypothetical protein NKR74_14715 [Bacillus sp. 3103sda1]|uniref:hypothetical protein n=1 Tax=Bacillus sp. 3103sda1 TaxID=2953808 RepID=UPI00209CFBFC|nr:hypothetical protein [Bacillus sp. 3103sda1]MCP1124541.1 hypothetical protein [Bacillus sp. 3103sda1]